jgi:hypothetical protein
VEAGAARPPSRPALATARPPNTPRQGRRRWGSTRRGSA